MPGNNWHGNYARRMTALVLETYGDRCHLCGQRGATTADHITPSSKGGNDDLDNLRPAHKSCNSRRGNLTIAEYRAKYGEIEALNPSRSW